MGQEIGQQRLEMRRAHRIVVVPPDGVLGQRVEHRELVLGRAACMRAGVGAERAAARQFALAGLKRALVELRRFKVPGHRGQLAEAEGLGAMGGVVVTDDVH